MCGDSMKKAKIFFLKTGIDKAEAEINEWLATNSERKILSTAGVGNAFFIVTYED
jgi:hypothetical protein